MSQRPRFRTDRSPAQRLRRPQALISLDVPLNNQSFDYEIVDLDGYVISSRKNVSSNVIDIGSLMSGMYAVRMKIGEKQLTRRLVVNP